MEKKNRTVIPGPPGTGKTYRLLNHYMAKEIKGVRIQQMPSLSGTDRWHKDNNFVHSVRAALALVYDNDLGKVAEFEERI